jgi:hypothetical protein
MSKVIDEIRKDIQSKVTQKVSPIQMKEWVDFAKKYIPRWMDTAIMSIDIIDKVMKEGTTDEKIKVLTSVFGTVFYDGYMTAKKEMEETN